MSTGGESPPKEPDILLTESFDDEGNAQCVHFRFGGKILYTDALGWLYYNGKNWEAKGSDEKIRRAIVSTLKKRRILAVKHEQEKLITAAKPSATNVKNCLYMLQSLAWTDYAEFDNDPDLLNCQNGVVDLRTGDITPHNPQQKFTYCLDTPYNPEADDSLWETWIYDTLKPKKDKDKDGQYAELAIWLQMAIGYSLTGHTHEQCLFYLQGPPRAGKGLLLQTLRRLISRPLSSGVDFDTFTGRRGPDNQNFDLAPLKPCRLVVASESERASLLNAKVVKAITGNDPVYCAFKHKAHFDYTPQFKIWLASNFKVMAQADDDGLWSRLRIIHFPNSHIGKEDFTLAEKLWINREGILKWAVEGAMLWYERKAKNIGLGKPKIIQDAVNDHRDENDTIAQFIADCCITGEAYFIPGATFTYEYRSWCDDNGLKPLGAKRLGQTMRRKGFEYKLKKIGGMPTKGWFGVGLLTNGNLK